MLERLTLAEARAGLREGAFSPRQLRQALVERIEACNPRLNAYCHWQAQDETEARVEGPLAGLPVTLKDNMNLRGTPTGCASALLAGHVSLYDSTAAARLRAAGGSYLGKTNMDEFAMGSSSEFSCYGPVRNPWDLARTAGGSSGGGAAAVAADLALFALGSDTGGSIRQPAAMCGVVGVKPSYGRVSRHGLVAFASSLDQIGPITKDVKDAALVLELIMGHDPADASSLDLPVPALVPETERDLAGLRVGVPRELADMALEAPVAAAYAEAQAALVAAGARRVEVTLPRLRFATAAYYLIATAEASSNLARFDGVRYGRREGEEAGVRGMFTRTRSAGFGPEVKRRILLGTFALSSGYYERYYGKAQQLRGLIQADFAAAFADCDLLVMPTAPSSAFPLGAKLDDPLAMYLSDIFTLPANLAGLPAASVPCAVAAGLPLGVQVYAPFLGEAVLIRAAAALERAFPFRERRREAVARVIDAGGLS